MASVGANLPGMVSGILAFRQALGWIDHISDSQHGMHTRERWLTVM